MKNFIKTFFETSSERIKNPFTGAFMISWIIFNWRALLLICFSNLSIEERINQINLNYVSIYSNLIFPLLLAIIYIGLIPYIMVVFDKILKKSVIERKGNLKEQMIIDLKAKQEITLEENKLEELKADYREKIELNEIIQDLQEKIDVRTAQLNALKDEFKTLNEDNLQLKEIAEQNDTATLGKEEIENFKKQYIEFKETDLFKYFRDIGLSIKKRNEFPYSIQDIVREMYEAQDIVTDIESKENNKKKFGFTQKGNYFWREFIINLKVIEPRNDESLKTQYKKLSGPKIAGDKIDLSKFNKPKKEDSEN
nr:hypothetical protein [uncultured Psychroserpens sp.]